MIGARPLRSWLIQDRPVAKDTDGVALVEFGFLAPIFVMLLLAIFDVGFGMYAQTVLRGAVEEGARTASLENTRWEDIKNRVNDQVRTVIPASDPDTDISFELDPLFYGNYNDITMPEDFTDSNGNSQWDPAECYVDRNNNQSYDTDVGLQGRGGAQDVVSIKAEVEFKRAFPLWNMIGQPQTLKLTARTYLRNQPFSAQASRVGVKICP